MACIIHQALIDGWRSPNADSYLGPNVDSHLDDDDADDSARQTVPPRPIAPVGVPHYDQGRSLHSSTSQLNVSAFCGMRGAFLGGAWGVCRRCHGVPGVI